MADGRKSNIGTGILDPEMILHTPIG